MGSLTAQALGNITSDIELKSTTNGKDFASFTVAVNHDRENTSFVRVAAWGKTAEVIAKYFGKGNQIFVSGTGKVNTWEDKSGNKRNEFEIQVKDFSFVDKKADNRPIAQHEVIAMTRDVAPTDVDDKIDLSEIPFN